MRFNREQKKVILLSSLGGGLEFYDFVIFAILGPYLSQNFFPVHSPVATLLATFTVFAIGYLARPLGGLIMSHFGDTHGRKKTFAFSITLMAFSTFCIGLLPSYASVGITATILFVLLRITQGFALGGEIPGAITFVYEHAKQYPTTACAFVFLFINTGMVLANLVHDGLIYLWGEESLYQWSWRLAFMLGGLLGFVSYFLRKKLHESPVFTPEMKKQAMPLKQLLEHHKALFIFGFLFSGFGAINVIFNALYLPNYMTQILGYSHTEASMTSLLFMIPLSVLVPFYGYLADSYPINRVFATAAALSLLLNVFLYHDLINHLGWHRYWVTAVGTITAGGTATFPVLLARLFPAHVRYTGIASCYNVAFAVCGGLGPLLATFLLGLNINYSPLLLIALATGLSLGVSLWLRQTYGVINSATAME